MLARYKGKHLNKSGRGTVISAGVTDHIQTQRPIHQKAKIPERIIAIRRANRNTPYPIHDDSDFACKQWDIVARVEGEDLKSAIETNNYIIQIPCSSTPAGLSGYENIQFLGLVLKKGDVRDDAVGDTVTFLQSGLCTMLAHEDTISPGDMVYMDWPGFTVNNGIPTPKSFIINRNHKMRFTWVARPLNMKTLLKQFHVAAVFVRDMFLEEIQEEMKDNNYRLNFEELLGDKFKIEVSDKMSFYKHLPFKERHDVCPLHKYAKWALLQLAIFSNGSGAGVRDTEQKEQLVVTANETSNREIANYQTALNGRGSSKRHKTNGSVPEVDLNGASDKDRVMMTIFATAEYPVHLVLEQQDLYQKRLIGRAVTHALPGGQFEIELGYKW